jgi:hypothetical protein
VSAASEAWVEETLASEADVVLEGQRERRHEVRAGSQLRPLTPPSGLAAEASAAGCWNVLTETLVEFPRPACRPFLDPDQLPADQQSSETANSYGQLWLERELAKLRVRTSDAYGEPAERRLAEVSREARPQALDSGARRHSRRPAQSRQSLRGAALAHALNLDDDPSAELRTTLDTFLSPIPERRARVARLAAQPRTRAALPRPRGLRRLLPGAATLVVLASLLTGAAALSAGRAHPTAVIPGSVKLPSGDYAYVVRPGDTLWSIASRLQPSGDPRPLVAQLQNQLHGSTLEPGDRLLLP